MRMILQLFFFFLLLMGLPDWYIYRTYIRKWKNRWIGRLFWLPSILLFLGMIVVFSGFEPRPHAMNTLSLFMIVFLCICVPKAIFSLFSILFRTITNKLKIHFYGTYIASAIALFTMGYLVFGATEGIQHFQIKEVTIQSSDVPKGFDGYRIIQLSDIHSGSWAGNPEAIQKAVHLINAQNPDLILFTGDIVNNLATELDEFIPILSQLKAKDGIYSVLGNHDYSMYIHWDSEKQKEANLESLKAKQAQMGWKLLNNKHVKIHHQGDSIAIIGVENCGHAPFPDFSDLPKAMQGTDGMFKILMSHDPTHWKKEVLPDTDIQLTLSGHTHAMQVKLFGFTPSQFIYPENDGLYQEGEQMLYVNIGLGYLMFPMRLGAWPEITLLTLKK